MLINLGAGQDKILYEFLKINEFLETIDHANVLIITSGYVENDDVDECKKIINEFKYKDQICIFIALDFATFQSSYFIAKQCDYVLHSSKINIIKDKNIIELYSYFPEFCFNEKNDPIVMQNNVCLYINSTISEVEQYSEYLFDENGEYLNNIFYVENSFEQFSDFMNSIEFIRVCKFMFIGKSKNELKAKWVDRSVYNALSLWCLPILSKTIDGLQHYDTRLPRALDGQSIKSIMNFYENEESRKSILYDIRQSVYDDKQKFKTQLLNIISGCTIV